MDQTNSDPQRHSTRLASPQSDRWATPRTAGAGGGQRPEGQSPQHQHAVQIHSTPQSRADRRGQGAAHGGRSVVVGTTAPGHRVSSRRWIAGTAPLVALTGGALTYAWRAGVVPGNALHRDTYTADRFSEPTDDLATLAWTAAGTLAGAALPYLSAGAGHAARYFKEWVHLKRSNDASGQGQLDAIVGEATRSGPLTDAGLRTCIDRLGAVRTGAGGDVEGLRVALAMARLAPVAMRADAGCLGGSPGAQEQLELLLGALARTHSNGRLTDRQFTRSLLAVAEALGPSANLPADQQAWVKDALLRKFETVAWGEGDHRLRARADFKVMLRGATALASQAHALAPTREELSACNGRDTQASDVNIPKLLGDAGNGRVQTQDINQLTIALTRGQSPGQDPSQLQRLNQTLGELVEANPNAPLGRAAGRARLLINHRTGQGLPSVGKAALGEVSPQAASLAGALAVSRHAGQAADWHDAPCRVLATLLEMASRSQENQPLQTLVARVITPDTLGQALARASAEDLPAEARAAGEIALMPDRPATELVDWLAAIARAVRHRHDLPPGTLLGGVVAPERVIQLITTIPRASIQDQVSFSNNLVAMTRLFQTGATTDHRDRVQDLLARVWLPTGAVRAPGQGMDKLNLDHYYQALVQHMTQRLVVDDAMGPLASGLHLPAPRNALAAASAGR